MISPRMFGCILVLAPLAAGPAAADPKEGQRLAERWCASCHVVGEAGAGSDAAPSFPRIAQDPRRSPDWLRAWLTDPHPPMPDLRLSRDEMDDIVDYLATLR
jgi:mono/diheme cytochrome c family protein